MSPSKKEPKSFGQKLPNLTALFGITKDIPNQVTKITKGVTEFFSFHYNDEPLSERTYYANRYWIRWIHDYYLKIQDLGFNQEANAIAKKEKVIVISNHSNTLEAYNLLYYFYIHKLGILRCMVFKQVFRLPFFRELLRGGRSIPVNVEAGVKALKKDHLLIFPEGMEFINRYFHNKPTPFHTGFLRIAKNHMQETGKKHVYIIPIGHSGFENALKFFVLEKGLFIDKVVKPLLHFPYFIVPTSPILPAKIAFHWGKPQKITAAQVKTNTQIDKLAKKFQKEVEKLCLKAKVYLDTKYH